MLDVLAEVLSALDVTPFGDRSPSWVGGAIVFSVMAAVIVGLWLLGHS